EDAPAASGERGGGRPALLDLLSEEGHRGAVGPEPGPLAGPGRGSGSGGRLPDRARRHLERAPLPAGAPLSEVGLVGVRTLHGGRALLKDDAYERIKQLIQTQVFKPGTFLAERELAARLGMSKTPVRSALERLQTEGFVQIAPKQGAVVREPSLHEIVDMIDFRIALEPYVLRRLVGRL